MAYSEKVLKVGEEKVIGPRRETASMRKQKEEEKVKTKEASPDRKEGGRKGCVEGRM